MERSEYKNISTDSMFLAEEIAKAHADWTDGCRVLFLIQRHSDGGHTNNSKLRSYITRNTEEWVSALAKLLDEKKSLQHLPLRIYQTLNARDIDKGIRHFKHMALDADYYDDNQRQWFYLDVRNRMVSALMKPPCKAQSFFLFDVDTQDVAVHLALKEELEKYTKIVHVYNTKNGAHVITNPFNPNMVALPKDVEFKKDAMMLLAF